MAAPVRESDTVIAALAVVAPLRLADAGTIRTISKLVVEAADLVSQRYADFAFG
ncbi:MAG: hypothetical protein JO147_03960 [Actinobacteria bacterium]|nr:hypothetical protein [Actinomycetota bacterium]